MYPEMPADVADEVPRPAPAAVRRVRRPQVRDVLPVRPGLPDRVHRHGRHGHEGPLPRPLGPARDVRRAARGIGAAPVRPDRAGPGRSSTSRRSTSTTIDEILDAHDHDPKHMLQILEATQAAFGLPARGRPQAHQRAHGGVVRDDLRHRLVLRPPALRAAGGDGAGRRRSAPAGRPTTSYLRHSAPRWAVAARTAQADAPRGDCVSAILPSPKGWPSILLARAGAKDPADLDAALKAGAFEALRRGDPRARARRARSPRCEASGLRGRGGAGHLTAAKWRAAAADAREGAATSSRTATARTRPRARTGRSSRRTRTR